MPPIVKKQQRVGPVGLADKGSIFERIAPLADIGGIKINIYGRGKTGKTRLACTFPKPCLILGTEDGTKSVLGIPEIYFVRLNGSSELGDICSGIVAGSLGKAYKTVILDTAGGLQDMILKEILGLNELPIQRSWGMAGREQWMICGSQTKERLRQLLDLADSHQMNTVIIAHERNFSEEGGSTSDVMTPQVGAALTPSAAGWLNTACDYICQCFIREETKEVTQTIAGKPVKTQQKTGKKEFCLRVGPHEIFLTGFRLPPGKELPEVIIDPDYNKIASLIGRT